MMTAMSRTDGWMEPPTAEEVDALVRGYSDDRLRENAAIAAEQPGTEWDRLLAGEMWRRGLSGEVTQ